jgi:hypothetical protein
MNPTAVARYRFEVPDWLASRPHRRRAIAIFRVLAFGIVIGAAASLLTLHPLTVLSCLLLVGLSFHPIFRWARDSDGTLPIFPLFALTLAPAFGLQFLARHPVVMEYPPTSHFAASLKLGAFLVVAIAAWRAVSRRAARPRRSLYLLPWDRLVWLSLVAVAAGALFEVVVRFGLVALPQQASSAIRFTASNVALFGCFYGAYVWGRGGFGAAAILFYLGCLGVIAALLAADFVIASIVLYVIVGLAGFGIARGRIPLLFLLGLLVALSILHAGKSDVRQRYARSTAHIEEVPQRMRDWGELGLRATREKLEGGEHLAPRRRTDLLQRVSLMHLFLLAQERMPDEVPRLNGATYRLVPRILVPRLLMPNKPRAHDGTHLIGVHFGLITWEGTRTTTIGCGLQNEAYVNFGLVGLLGLGLLLGAGLGQVERLVRGYPVNSLRFILAIVVLRTMINTEMSAGVFASTLLQGTVATLAVSLVVMRKVPWPQDSHGPQVSA